MKCPECEATWEKNSEQAVSVELFGVCLACNRFDVTQEELEKILRVQESRKNAEEIQDGRID